MKLLFCMLVALPGFALTYNPRRLPRQVQAGENAEANEDVCSFNECKITADRFLNNMNKEVDPCEDFYEFSCGGYIAQNEDPNNVFETIRTDNNEKMLGVVYNTTDIPDIKPVMFLKKFLSMCEDKASIRNRGAEPLLDRLGKAGGFPILNKNWDDSHWSVTNQEILLTRWLEAGKSLFDLAVEINFNNPEKRVITINEPALALTRNVILKGPSDENVKSYNEALQRIALGLGADNDTAADDISQVMSFLTELGRISADEVEKRDTTKQNNVFTIAQLETHWPWVKWLDLFQSLAPPEVQITNNDEVMVPLPSYFSSLGKLLTQFPNRVVANYMFFQAIKSVGDYLPEKLQVTPQADLDFEASLTSDQLIKYHRLQCVSPFVSPDSELGAAMSHIYLKTYADQDKRQKVIDMLENMKKEIIRLIDDLQWMDPNTKNQARKKANSMKSLVAYEQEMLNENNIIVFYSQLHMNTTHYFEAGVDLRRWARQHEWSQLHKTIHRGDWRHFPSVTIINAFYDFNWNLIVVPDGILQLPIFHHKLPASLRYGSIGASLGHEIIHGYDDQGMNFAWDGKMDNWWDSNSKSTYSTLKQCVIDQYGSYNDTKNTNLKVNGHLTQGENIADNVGLRLAYRAYKGDKEPQKKLPGLEKYSSDQLFFISFANFWCAKQDPAVLADDIANDPHTPNEFRVKGCLQNSVDFSQAFQCKQGSGMNPIKKCGISVPTN